jgi:hypothetical protein
MWSVGKLQRDFFLNDLPFSSDDEDGRDSPGRYLYQKSGLVAVSGTVVLFQYCSSLIAGAVLRRVERFRTPRIERRDHLRFEYHGALHFFPLSIRVFDPVGEDVVRRIWPRFYRFSHVKWCRKPERYAAFERELKHVEAANP